MYANYNLVALTSVASFNCLKNISITPNLILDSEVDLRWRISTLHPLSAEAEALVEGHMLSHREHFDSNSTGLAQSPPDATTFPFCFVTGAASLVTCTLSNQIFSLNLSNVSQAVWKQLSLCKAFSGSTDVLTLGLFWFPSAGTALYSTSLGHV